MCVIHLSRQNVTHSSSWANPDHLNGPFTLQACESGRQKNKLTLCPAAHLGKNKCVCLDTRSSLWGVSGEASSTLPCWKEIKREPLIWWDADLSRAQTDVISLSELLARRLICVDGRIPHLQLMDTESESLCNIYVLKESSVSSKDHLSVKGTPGSHFWILWLCNPIYMYGIPSVIYSIVDCPYLVFLAVVLLY